MKRFFGALLGLLIPLAGLFTAANIAAHFGDYRLAWGLRDAEFAVEHTIAPGRAFAMIGLPSPVQLDPRNWGCAGDGVTDDTTCLQNTFKFAATMSWGPSIMLGGHPYAVDTTVICQSCQGVILERGEILPIAAWSAGNIPMIEFKQGNHNTIRNVLFEATTAHTADGLLMLGEQGFTIAYNNFHHEHDYGVDITSYLQPQSSAGGTVVHNEGYEWGSGDLPQFLSYSNFTASGIIYAMGDILSTRNAFGWWKQPMELGDGTYSASNSFFTSEHPYNGCSGVSGCSRIAPVGILVQAGSGNDFFEGLYLDDSSVVMHDDNLIFTGGHLVGPVAGVCFYSNTEGHALARFVDYPSASNQVPFIQFTGPWYGGGQDEPTGCPDAGGEVQLFYADPNGGSWNTNTTALNNMLNQFTTSGVPQGIINTAPTSVHIFQLMGSNVNACVDLTGNYANAMGTSLCNLNGNNLFVQVGKNNIAALGIDANGHIQFQGAQPTCTSGCTTAPLIMGDDILFQVKMNSNSGTETSPMTFTWGANGGYKNAPLCWAQDPTTPATVVGATGGTASVVVTASAINTADEIIVHCAQALATSDPGG